MPDARPNLEARARDWVRGQLSPERFQHTAGVVQAAERLAAHYCPEAAPALRIAGWIHDAAKERPDSDLLTLAEEGGYAIRPVERAYPPLLHGAAAITLARRDLHIDDPVITTAVLYHTTGHPEMTTPDKAFYLADLIEPGRPYAWIAQVRELAADDLDTALLFALTHQLRRLLKKGAVIDPLAVELRNRLLLDGTPLVPRRTP